MTLPVISANWLLAVALVIGGVTAGLPLVLLSSIRLSAKKLLIGVAGSIFLAVICSAVIALGGTCSFASTLFLIESGCSFQPFLSPRTVPVLLIFSLTCAILYLFALIRDLALWIKRA